MTIGELDRRVELYNISTTANDYGELTRSYNLFRTVWASIIWKGGTEKLDDSDKITGMQKVHIYIRNIDVSSFTLQSLVKVDNDRYFPKVINEVDGRKGFLEIICELKD
tara:strand:+ start:754 stop:1080 length:327 start_codon:yes stop_codon:yes gene_type:complete